MVSERVDKTTAEVHERGSAGAAVDRRVGGNGWLARSRGALAGLTIADGLMVVIGLVAAVARLGALASQPLSPDEAGAALSSWQFAHGATLSAPIGSPAYFSLTNLVMSASAGGDAAARLLPALLGTLTVLLPWLWRGRARPAAWLAAAGFLAASPLAIALSRTAGGDGIALFALVLLAVAAFRLDEGRRWGATAGAALGLGLTTTPLFYTGLVALLPAWWAYGGPDEMRRATWRDLAIAAGLVFTAVATSGLFYPGGVGAAAQLLPTWLAQFGLPDGGAWAILAPFLALLRYEPALLFLGLPAAVWVVVRAGRPGKLYALWLALLLPVLLLQATAFHNAAAAVVPGYLLIGLLAGDLSTEAAHNGRRTSWLVAGGLALLGMVLLVSVGRFTRLGLWSGGQASLVGLAVLAFVFAGIAVILALAWDNASARRGAFLGVAALLLYWQWGTAWQLSRQGANDPRERWVVAGTDDDVPVMVDLLRNTSLQTANSDHDLEIFSTVESPVLRWYFRNYERFAAGPTLPLQAQPAVIITPADAEPQATSDYFGADFGLEQRDVAADALGPPAAADVLRWWLFRESFAPVEQRRVVVWVRSDLATAR